MAALKVNKQVLKRYQLKKLAKKRKRIGTGDGGLLSEKMLNRK